MRLVGGAQRSRIRLRGAAGTEPQAIIARLGSLRRAHKSIIQTALAGFRQMLFLLRAMAGWGADGLLLADFHE